MLGNIGPMQLLIIFLIVLLIFGTKKLRNVGGDLGSAIRDFRKGVSNENEHDDSKDNRDDNREDSRDDNRKNHATGKSTSAETGDDSGKSKP